MKDVENPRLSLINVENFAYKNYTIPLFSYFEIPKELKNRKYL